MNKAEKFIAIHRVTKQTHQYCDMLLDIYREMSETKVDFEPNSAMLEQLQSFGTVSVETSRVTDVFTDATPIYTGEMKLKSAQRRSDDDDDVDDNYDPTVTAYEMLQNRRKLVLGINNDKIQLYENNNTLVTETAIAVDEDEKCISLVHDNNTEALVSTSYGKVFKVKIDDELTVREIKTSHKILPMTKYGEDILCVAGDDSDYLQLCVMDKNMKKVIKTILKDDGTLFLAPFYLGVSDDKNTVYVLDFKKACYGITVDGQVVFHYHNPEVKCYLGLVVDSDGLFIGCGYDNKFQLEKLNFSGERQEVCSSLGNALPLKLVENELVLFHKYIVFYSVLK